MPRESDPRRAAFVRDCAGMPTYRYVVADVFTDRPLAGNQLGVFTDARDIPEEQLQPLGREMNFSEALPRRSHVPRS